MSSLCLSWSLSLHLRMLERALLRTTLLLWLAQLTLQGGTGYKPQNGGLGQMLMPSKGYGPGAQNANGYQPNTKAQGYGPAAPQANGNGAKGYGAAQATGNNGKPSGPYKGYGVAPAALGNGAKPNGPYKGYGAVPAALGNGAKPNGPYKGYSAVPASLGNGNGAKPNGYGNNGKPNGFGAFAGATKGNGGYGPAPVASKGQGPKPNGYGASPFTSNGQQAKMKPNGGYGSKPNKPGYGAQPAYGGFGAGMRVAPQMANKGRGGYGKGNGFGYAGSSFAGYRNRPAAYPQAGQAGGYPNGAKATKPGYGGRPLTPSGQAAKPNGYGPNAQGAKPAGYGDTRGPKAGYGGYPNGGGFKGPKPGYGGLPTGYGQRPNGYGGYPNGGAKAPKPGYGVPAGVPKVKPGYGPVTDSSEKRPKEQSLGPEAPNVQSVTGYIKGVVQPAEPEPTVGVPTALPPTKGMPSFVTGWKRPKPQVPVFPQGYPSKPIVQEQSPMIPQNKASKPVQYIPQEQAPIPELAPLIPQAKPVVPALLPFAEQGKGPKPYTQVLQSAAPVYPQGNGPNPVTLQPAVPQNKGPKPAASVLLPVFLQTKGPKPVSPIPEIPQTKDTKPVAPEPAAPQTAGSVLSLEPTPAMPQMKGPKLANPDCGLGVSGQWTKLPSPGYGPGPWYPNNGGAKASKPGLGFGPKAKQPGYGNPGAGYGYGNGAGASLGEVMKGKTGGAGQLPYNGAPIIPARLDEYESEPCFEAGTNPIEPQTAELGPGVKSGHAYGGPYGAQPAGFGSEGKPQVRYGIGGLLFGGSPMGYSPYENYGNPFVAQPYGSKAAGNYNPPEFNTNPKSAAKYMMGGSPYSASPSDPKASGKYGPYGGQQHGFPAVAGNSGKYGNPSLPFEALGPVTDGQLVEQPALQYEAPAIDGVKSVDQFGEGEVQPQPIAPLVDRAGQEPASYIKGGVRAEAVSLPAAPTDGPFTGSATSLGNSPVDTPTEVETPQHNLAQQKHKGPQLPQAWTGGNEQKHNLKGFFGNGYHG